MHVDSLYLFLTLVISKGVATDYQNFPVKRFVLIICSLNVVYSLVINFEVHAAHFARW